jgi:hypothetical protein
MLRLGLLISGKTSQLQERSHEVYLEIGVFLSVPIQFLDQHASRALKIDRALQHRCLLSYQTFSTTHEAKEAKQDEARGRQARPASNHAPRLPNLKRSTNFV